MKLFPLLLAVGMPALLLGVVLIRLWLFGDAGAGKPDGDLSDPDDLTLTKLRLNEQPSTVAKRDDL